MRFIQLLPILFLVSCSEEIRKGGIPDSLNIIRDSVRKADSVSMADSMRIHDVHSIRLWTPPVGHMAGTVPACDTNIIKKYVTWHDTLEWHPQMIYTKLKFHSGNQKFDAYLAQLFSGMENYMIKEERRMFDPNPAEGEEEVDTARNGGGISIQPFFMNDKLASFSIMTGGWHWMETFYENYSYQNNTVRSVSLRDIFDPSVKLDTCYFNRKTLEVWGKTKLDAAPYMVGNDVICFSELFEQEQTESTSNSDGLTYEYVSFSFDRNGIIFRESGAYPSGPDVHTSFEEVFVPNKSIDPLLKKEYRSENRDQ